MTWMQASLPVSHGGAGLFYSLELALARAGVLQYLVHGPTLLGLHDLQGKARLKQDHALLDALIECLLPWSH